MKLIVNQHISLSDIEPADKAAYVEYLNDKDIYDRTLRVPHPYTEADADRWLASVAKATAEHGQPVNWAIRDADGLLIGGIGFDGLVIGKSHQAEIGYWLAKPYWNRGIMNAVVRRTCEFAFSEWGLVKITAHVFSFNTASARVLEKSGFEQEGYLKKHVLKDGRFIDIKLYGRLAASGVESA